MRLAYAMRYSTHLDEMKRFYGESLGLALASDTPGFVAFGTGTTNLALLAISTDQQAEFELCFEVDDVEASIEELRGHGMEFADDLRQQEFGRLIHMRDPEGNVVTLLQPARRAPAGGAPSLASVIVNTWDYGSALNFYRDRLRLPVLAETQHWVEFGTDGARITVHARAERPDLPAHAKQKVACVFEVEDLDAWSEGLEGRGGSLATEPTEEEFGTYAEAIDPDGNMVVFRQPPSLVPVPEIVAEAFEDDDVPHQAGMRKPLKKRAKAVSRVALKPDYKSKPKSQRNQQASEASPTSARIAEASASNGKPKKPRIVSTRGAGLERTRLQPRTRTDTKRANPKQAIGRQKKATTRTMESKKESVATASRGRPVKAGKKGSARK